MVDAPVTKRALKHFAITLLAAIAASNLFLLAATVAGAM
ncbi:hypothetical protein OF001_U20311 [Pseudomonas sp. OF001]|nr:hypothetical protein OF001_U20311 [Pseudomonas sp. OF001]